MNREPIFDQDTLSEMGVARVKAQRASVFVWHDVIVLEAPLTVANVTFNAGAHLRVERPFTVHEPLMRLTLVNDDRWQDTTVDVSGYDLIDVKHHVIPAPNNEPF